ncbi:hypothetical protein HDU67_005675 [Dinochytrium kinnereticum]|nr:hypothetical protein HDU67_005675 [Dinochytrium kinnereticum]
MLAAASSPSPSTPLTLSKIAAKKWFEENRWNRFTTFEAAWAEVAVKHGQEARTALASTMKWARKSTSSGPLRSARKGFGSKRHSPYSIKHKTGLSEEVRDMTLEFARVVSLKERTETLESFYGSSLQSMLDSQLYQHFTKYVQKTYTATITKPQFKRAEAADPVFDNAVQDIVRIILNYTLESLDRKAFLSESVVFSVPMYINVTKALLSAKKLLYSMNMEREWAVYASRVLGSQWV